MKEQVRAVEGFVPELSLAAVWAAVYQKRPEKGRSSEVAYVSGLDKITNIEVQLAAIRNSKLGFVFQSFNLLAHTSALRNVMLPLIYDRSHRVAREEWEGQAREMLTAVGLGDRMDHRPHELSGGQQQRAAIARALITHPVLIIADEPTGNLDSKSGEEIMQLFHNLHEQGATLVIVTHDPVVSAHTERVIHLKDGHIDTVVHNGNNGKKHPAEKELSHESA